MTIMQAAADIEECVMRGLTNSQICATLDVHAEFVRSVRASMRRRAR